MKLLHLTVTVTVIAILAFGCATVGKDFPSENVKRIRIGDTSKDDILAWFGQPWRTGIDDGDETWTYGKYKYRMLGDTDTKDLVIRFNDNGVVKSYTFNETGRDVSAE